MVDLSNLQDFRLRLAPKWVGLSNAAFLCTHNKLLATVIVASMAESTSSCQPCFSQQCSADTLSVEVANRMFSFVNRFENLCHS